VSEANLVHRTIMLYEAAQHLGALQDRERARLSPKVNAALDEGRAISTADYKVALVLRDAAIVSFTEWLAAYDAIIAPPATGPAPEGLDSTGDLPLPAASVRYHHPRAFAADRARGPRPAARHAACGSRRRRRQAPRGCGVVRSAPAVQGPRLT
jgi:Asp-tRNA(Asn)/Glu-tRNA(Gln) amidotransferase A subunit family amidase